MKLFENGVGRPTNETIKKRRVFYMCTALLLIATITIIGVYLSNKFNYNLNSATNNAQVKPSKPTKDNIKLYKWFTNSESGNPSKGGKALQKASIIANDKWSNRYVYALVSGVKNATYYEYIVSGASGGSKKDKVQKGNYWNFKSEGISYIQFRACNNGGCSAYSDKYTIKIDKTAPSIPIVKLYKWKTNAESNKPSTNNLKGATKYDGYSITNHYVFAVASGSNDSTSGIDHYEYTITGASTNSTNKKGSYWHFKASGRSYIKFRACDKATNCSEYTSNNFINLNTEYNKPKIVKLSLYPESSNTSVIHVPYWKGDFKIQIYVKSNFSMNRTLTNNDIIVGKSLALNGNVEMIYNKLEPLKGYQGSYLIPLTTKALITTKGISTNITIKKGAFANTNGDIFDEYTIPINLTTSDY